MTAIWVPKSVRALSATGQKARRVLSSGDRSVFGDAEFDVLSGDDDGDGGDRLDDQPRRIAVEVELRSGMSA